MAQPVDLSALVADLQHERAYVEGLISDLAEADWDLPTPAEGWSLKDQIWHLAYFDGAAAWSLSKPEEFRVHAADADAEVDRFLAGVVEQGRDRSPAGVHAAWRSAAERFDTAALAADPALRAPWYGVAMAAPSLVTARIMETWAHGVDVADTLGAPVSDSERVAHIVFLGWRAMPFSYRIHGRTPPAGGVRVEVVTTTGTRIALGPEDGDGRVTGSALEFALVVVQRRHWRDTTLEITGAATDWIDIAQAYAGPPGTGREPRGVAATDVRARAVARSDAAEAGGPPAQPQPR
jgi:uncharacterized protein (TIGR03084 family)